MRRQDTFTLGVNYWPRKKAMYWWKDFERAENTVTFVGVSVSPDKNRPPICCSHLPHIRDICLFSIFRCCC